MPKRPAAEMGVRMTPKRKKWLAEIPAVSNAPADATSSSQPLPPPVPVPLASTSKRKNSQSAGSETSSRRGSINNGAGSGAAANGQPKDGGSKQKRGLRSASKKAKTGDDGKKEKKAKQKKRKETTPPVPETQAEPASGAGGSGAGGQSENEQEGDEKRKPTAYKLTLKDWAMVKVASQKVEEKVACTAFCGLKLEQYNEPPHRQWWWRTTSAANKEGTKQAKQLAKCESNPWWNATVNEQRARIDQHMEQPSVTSKGYAKGVDFIPHERGVRGQFGKKPKKAPMDSGDESDTAPGDASKQPSSKAADKGKELARSNPSDAASEAGSSLSNPGNALPHQGQSMLPSLSTEAKKNIGRVIAEAAEAMARGRNLSSDEIRAITKKEISVPYNQTKAVLKIWARCNSAGHTGDCKCDVAAKKAWKAEGIHKKPVDEGWRQKCRDDVYGIKDWVDDRCMGDDKVGSVLRLIGQAEWW